MRVDLRLRCGCIPHPPKMSADYGEDFDEQWDIEALRSPFWVRLPDIKDWSWSYKNTELHSGGFSKNQ